MEATATAIAFLLGAVMGGLLVTIHRAVAITEIKREFERDLIASAMRLDCGPATLSHEHGQPVTAAADKATRSHTIM